MLAILKSLRLHSVLLIPIAFLFAITQASALQQSVGINHARVAIPSADIPSVSPYSPPVSGAPLPSVQPAKSNVAQAAGSSSCVPGSSQPAALAALVAALKCDPDLIFEYVSNNIEFEALYGSNKGPLGTLLDRRGDDADQAILLVTLWNIAGFSSC